ITASYRESPSPSPASPPIRIVPAWAMKPQNGPTSPATARVAPFSEMPALSEALPSTTISPPCAEAAAAWLASPCTRTEPDIVLRNPPAGRPADRDGGPLTQPADVVTGRAVDGEADLGLQPDREAVTAARVADCHRCS